MVSGGRERQPELAARWGLERRDPGAGELTYNTTDYTCQFCNTYTCWYPGGQVQLTNWVWDDEWGAGHASSGPAVVNTGGCPSQYGGPNSLTARGHHHLARTATKTKSPLMAAAFYDTLSSRTPVLAVVVWGSALLKLARW